jgi:hypothetical protein
VYDAIAIVYDFFIALLLIGLIALVGNAIFGG